MILRKTILTMSVSSAVGFLIIIALIVFTLMRLFRKQATNLTDNNIEDGYDEINPYDEIPAEQVDIHVPVTTEQHTILLRPVQIQRGRYLSLPIINIPYTVDEYLTPYMTLTPDRSDYLSPYSATHHGNRPRMKRYKSCGDSFPHYKLNHRKSF